MKPLYYRALRREVRSERGQSTLSIIFPLSNQDIQRYRTIPGLERGKKGVRLTISWVIDTLKK
jgi:hypothetical protein